jgi:hypothetical protein
MTPEIALGTITIVVYVVTVVAILVAPIIALKVQRKSDEGREATNRKLWIFKTLMSNRATRWNPVCVQALNMIDIEFTEKTEKEIRDAWRELLDHYNDWGRKTPELRHIDDNKDIETAANLLAELLVKMGERLGYDFDKVYVKKAWYFPEGLGNIEQEQHALRKAVLSLLSGQGTKLPVAVFTQDFQPITVQPREAAQAPRLQPALVRQLEDGEPQL